MQQSDAAVCMCVTATKGHPEQSAGGPTHGALGLELASDDAAIA